MSFIFCCHSLSISKRARLNQVVNIFASASRLETEVNGSILITPCKFDLHVLDWKSRMLIEGFINSPRTGTLTKDERKETVDGNISPLRVQLSNLFASANSEINIAKTSLSWKKNHFCCIQIKKPRGNTRANPLVILICDNTTTSTTFSNRKGCRQ